MSVKIKKEWKQKQNFSGLDYSVKALDLDIFDTVKTIKKEK